MDLIPSLTKGRPAISQQIKNWPLKTYQNMRSLGPSKLGLRMGQEAEQADLGRIEPPKLGAANAEASETQRRIQWATDPAVLAQLYYFFTRLWRGYLTTCLFCLGCLQEVWGPHRLVELWVDFVFPSSMNEA